MLRFGRGRRRRTLDQVNDYATVIGPDSVFRGTLTGKDDYVVHGRVHGDGDLAGTIVLLGTARWDGDLTADNIIINGEVTGDVTARVKLELGPTARIRGDLASPVIAIAEGAAFDGEIRMKQTQVTRYSERRGLVPADKSA
jgi:cytoskeletal protein CcmA (bactofilin family)